MHSLGLISQDDVDKDAESANSSHCRLLACFGQVYHRELSGTKAPGVQRLEAQVMRSMILDDGRRADGRGLTDVRAIASRCGLLPRSHGSALFTRGETQALAVTTLGKGLMEKLVVCTSFTLLSGY